MIKIKPYKTLVEKIARTPKKIIVSDLIRESCIKLSIDYYSGVKYLLRHGYIERIFRGIFYNYSLEERKLGKSEMSFYEILSEALMVKGIKNWYFGLETALKLNNMTHEYFSTIFIVNDTIFRARPINIMGHKLKFLRTTLPLFDFGIITKSTSKGIKYSFSNPEKTALELVYFKHYSEDEFLEIFSELSPDRLIKYSLHYDRIVPKVMDHVKERINRFHINQKKDKPERVD